MFRLAPTLAIAAAIAAAPAAAQSVKAGDLTLGSPQLRASLGRNPNTGGYVVVENAAGRPDELVGASCECAREVQLHVMSHEGGVMRMRQVDSLTVPARGRLELKPGGAHLMVMGLKAPLKAGAQAQLTLRFRRAGAVTVPFRVVAQPAKGEHAGH